MLHTRRAESIFTWSTQIIGEPLPLIELERSTRTRLRIAYDVRVASVSTIKTAIVALDDRHHNNNNLTRNMGLSDCGAHHDLNLAQPQQSRSLARHTKTTHGNRKPRPHTKTTYANYRHNNTAIMSGWLLHNEDTPFRRSEAEAEGGFENARAELAAKNGYVDPIEPPKAQQTPKKRSSPFGRPANPFINRIASIKRGGGKARSASPLTGPSTTFTPPNTFTTTPSSFSFGAQQAQQQPSTGFGGSESFTFGQQQPSEGNGMDRIEQSSTPAPAASFTFGQSQPQQPTSNGFGQQNNNPFGGFGQSSAAPAGGAQTTPSFSFGAQQSSTSTNANSNPFGGFGQQTQTSNAPSTSFGFGAQSQSSSPAPTNPFSGFNSQPQQNGTPAPSNSFTFGAQPSNSQPSANGTTTPSFSFGATQPTQPPTSQTTSSLFAPQPSTEQRSQSPFQGSNSLFSKPAEAPKSDGWASFKSASPAATPGGEAPGTSVLSGWQKEQTSKPAFSFSASQMPTGDVDDDDAMASPEKPTPAQPASSAFGGGSNLFGSSQPAASAGNDLFSRISKPTETNTTPAEQPVDSVATPKAPTSSGGDLFGRMTFPDKAKDQTISATPAPKASNPFSGFSVAPPATAPAKNLFSGASNGFGVPSTPTPAAEKAPEAPATVKPAQSFSTSSLFSANTPKSSTTSSLFAPKPAVEEVSESSATPKAAPASTNSLFSSGTPKQPAAQPATSLFTPAPSQGSGFSATNAFQPPPQPQTARKATATESVNAFDTAGASEMRQLNEGFQQRLAAADPDADYSQLIKFYLKKAKAINGGKVNQGQKPAGMSFGQTPKPAASKGLFQRTPSTVSQNGTGDVQSNGTASKPRQAGEPNGVDLTKSLFAPRPSEAQTPKPAFTNGLFGRVPATEPRQGGAKRSIEDDDNNVPQTEFKRRKSKETVEYPKLPAGASNTAKLFEAALDKPAESGAAAKSLFASKPTTTEPTTTEQTPKAPTFGAFKPSTSSLFTPAKKDSDTPQTKGNGVATSTSLFTPKPAAKAEMPKPAAAGGFMPTFAAPPAGGSNFLSAFGQNASKEQDQARKKAMDEDFDSEDDDPEEWKKQYEEKQAAKRKAIEDAAKSGGGFSIKPATPKPAAKEQEKQESTPAGENNTWKQGTPIKFGTQDKTPAVPSTAPPAKSGGLFGGNAGSSLFANMGSQTPQPSSGSSLFSQAKPAQTNGASLFSFPKPAESSAPKPAEPAQSNTEATTNGEGNDDEEAANEPQVEDMTALQPAEQEESDILYHIEKAKSYKFETKASSDKPEWVYKALGPVWLLRNKTTGKTRVLQKVAPLGKAGMNFNVLQAAGMYAQQTKRVTASFIDHINEKDAKKPSQWFVQCGKEEDAKELARLLKEEAAKQ